MGGSGIQRWQKFAKYLSTFGWQAVIYTPSNPDMTLVDTTLLKDIPDSVEIVKRPIIEPYTIHKAFLGKKKRSNPSPVNPISSMSDMGLKEKISLWIRANFFIPDARCLWIKPSISFLKDYLKENPVDVIVSTGPPHSMHLIAKALKKDLGLKWLADFRDPWTKIFYHKYLPLLPKARKKHLRLEEETLAQADAVLSVSNQVIKEFKDLLKESKQEESESDKFHVITNGFDWDDMPKENIEQEEGFCITNTGLFSKDGNPLKLWKVLAQIARESDSFRKDLKIRLVGKVDPQVKEAIDSELGELIPPERIEYLGYLPHHQACIYQRKSTVLLLPLRIDPEWAALFSGKYYEYLAAKRPIVAFGPKQGELASSLEELNCGKIFEWEEEESLKVYLEELYLKRDKLELLKDDELNKYSRAYLTGSLAEVLNSLIK